MLDGIQVKMGGREFIIPPLNFSSLRKYLPKIQEMMAEKDPLKLLDINSEILLAALRRNYPELKIDELEELLDFKNVQEIIEALMEASGLKKQGEIRAGSDQTGIKSTLTS